MTHWDGLTSSTTSGQPERILILGATNRIQDIDEAILRRMPKKFPVSLPSATQRRRILKLILRDTRLDPVHFDWERLVALTAGMSGSDIKEACRDAAMVPVREFIRERRRANLSSSGDSGAAGVGGGVDDIDLDLKLVRGVRSDDFFGGTQARSNPSMATTVNGDDDGNDDWIDEEDEEDQGNKGIRNRNSHPYRPRPRSRRHPSSDDRRPEAESVEGVNDAEVAEDGEEEEEERFQESVEGPSVSR